jgi:hypothetical protein
MPRRRIGDAVPYGAQRSGLESPEHPLNSDANLLCRVQSMAIIKLGVARGWVSRPQSDTAANMTSLAAAKTPGGARSQGTSYAPHQELDHTGSSTEVNYGDTSFCNRRKWFWPCSVTVAQRQSLHLFGNQRTYRMLLDVEGVVILRKGIRWHRKSN